MMHQESRRGPVLFVAASAYSVALVKCLVANGADPKIRDRDGWHALQFIMLGIMNYDSTHQGVR